MAEESIVAVDEVLEAVECLENNALMAFEDITKRLKDLEILYTTTLDQNLRTNELIQATERQISNEYNKQELFETNINQSKTNIENFEVTVHELRALITKREGECSKLEEEVAALQAKINSVLEKKESLSRKKDIILTYKVLTGVDFAYSTNKVKGSVNEEVPKPFILNPQQLSQEEITQKLWEIIGEK